MIDANQLDMPSHRPRNPRGGRPRIDPAERRTIPLRLFQNEGEDAKLRQDAAAAGMGRHDYVRALINDHKPSTRGRGYDPRLLFELNAIGNNLNQAVRDMNAGSQRSHDWEQLRELLHDVLLKVALGENGDVH